MLRHYALRIEQEVAISLLFSNGQRHTSESALPLVSICRAVLVLTGKLSYRKEPCYTKLPSANALKRSARVCRTGSFLFSRFFVCVFACVLQDTDNRAYPRKCYRHQRKMCEGCKQTSTTVIQPRHCSAFHPTLLNGEIKQCSKAVQQQQQQ